MSAFLVGDETIDRCVTAIVKTEDTTREAAYSQHLGYELRAMNIAALRARYGDRLSADETDPSYLFGEFSSASPVEQWKALHCLLYQCNEGDIDEWPLYARCAAAAQKMEEGHKLSRKTPEYERAMWGD